MPLLESQRCKTLSGMVGSFLRVIRSIAKLPLCETNMIGLRAARDPQCLLDSEATFTCHNRSWVLTLNMALGLRVHCYPALGPWGPLSVLSG